MRFWWIMDRAYLDLFAFSKGNRSEINRKAIELKKRFKQWGKPFEDGHIYFLKASKSVLEERMARRGTNKRIHGKVSFETDTLVEQEAELRKIYRPTPNSVFDTSDLTVGETAKKIARTMLLEDYIPFSFSGRLNEIIKKRGAL